MQGLGLLVTLVREQTEALEPLLVDVITGAVNRAAVTYACRVRAFERRWLFGLTRAERANPRHEACGTTSLRRREPSENDALRDGLNVLGVRSHVGGRRYQEHLPSTNLGVDASNRMVFDAKKSADFERQVQVIFREIANDIRDHVLGVENAEVTVLVT